MKVFNVGAHRTGSGSFQLAMVELEFKCFMDQSISYRYFPPSMHQCEEYIEKFIKDRKRDFEKNNFFGDSPFNLGENYKHLDKAFPGSKFILTIRDPNNWYNSILRWARIKYYDIMYNFTKVSKEEVIKQYMDRNKAVMEYFKDRPSDLLVMCVEKGDGYPKLCRFLNLPCNEKPFPHNHKTK